MLLHLFKKSHLQPTQPFQLRAVVLMYHHIGQVHRSDPWNMSVDLAAFEQQLQLLASAFEVRPLSEILNVVQAQQVGKQIVCLTFDDGYAEHYTQVFPLLQRYKLPATFFIPSAYLQPDYLCWWEVVDHVYLDHDPVPPITDVLPRRDVFDEQARSSLLVTQPSDAMVAYHAWHVRMKANPRQEQRWARELLRRCGHAADVLPPMLTENQLLEMAADPLISIGGHGFHHHALGLMSRRQQWKEIITNKQHLETLLGKPIAYFAYPHGHYNEFTPKLVQKAGYRLACSTSTDLDTPDINPYEIPRVWAQNWTAEELELLLEKLFQMME
ncbi:MAG: polysaccharide deacetylase family protein [Thermoflavifilum sp.]|nr:polysaccharide deacetylase family protein [Thermoflavifilum sp.]